MPDFYIDCAEDFSPGVALERQKTGASGMEPYAGITGVTMTLSATRDGLTPIHATLQDRATVELADEPGTIRPSPVFDVTDLQTHLLPTYKNKKVFLALFKSGEIARQPMECVVRADRLGP